MDENKPELTDPSATAANEAVNPDNSHEQLVAERVAEAMKGKNPDSSANEKATSSDGGSTSDVQSEKVSSQASNPEKDALQLIEASTGRKFANADEAKKYLTNLNSLVGDQAIAKARDAARQYETLAAKLAEHNGKPVEEVKRLLADELIGNLTAQSEPKAETKGDSKEYTRMNTEVEKLRGKLERQELLAKYPFAAEVQEDIQILANQKGISQLEAFEASTIKSLLETKVKEDSAKSPVVTSSNKVSIDTSKVKEKVARVVARGTEDGRIELVKQFASRVGL